MESVIEDRLSMMEWKCWQEFIHEMYFVFEKKNPELNDKKYVRLFSLIEDWGIANARHRVVQKEIGKFDIMTNDGKLFRKA